MIISKTCPACNFSYIPSIETNRRQHAKIHNEVVHGIKWAGYKNEKALCSKGLTKIIQIDDSSPQHMRKRAAKVGQLGNRETMYDFGVYGAYEVGVIALIGIIKDRAISILVLSKMSEIWKSSWEEWDELPTGSDLGDKLTKVDNVLGCSYYWMMKKYRGTKMVKKMVECAESIACNSKNILPLMRPPLTPHGKNFFKKYYPDSVTFCWPA